MARITDRCRLIQTKKKKKKERERERKKETVSNRVLGKGGAN